MHSGKCIKDIIEQDNKLLIQYTDGFNEALDAINVAISWYVWSSETFFRWYGFKYNPSDNIKKLAKQAMASDAAIFNREWIEPKDKEVSLQLETDGQYTMFNLIR